MKKYLNILLALSVAGLLFSGYLSAVKLVTNVCALGESCPIVWGYPACWYGFALYLALFILSAVAREIPRSTKGLVTSIAVVAFVGMVFSGSLIIGEINSWIELGYKPAYTLGLPTCAYGFIFYIITFGVAARAHRRL